MPGLCPRRLRATREGGSCCPSWKPFWTLSGFRWRAKGHTAWRPVRNSNCRLERLRSRAGWWDNGAVRGDERPKVPPVDRRIVVRGAAREILHAAEECLVQDDGVMENRAGGRRGVGVVLSCSKILVPKKGLEPPHPCGYMDLNHARLPIPPRWQKMTGMRQSCWSRLPGKDYA